MLPIFPNHRPPGILAAFVLFALGFFFGLVTLHLYSAPEYRSNSNTILPSSSSSSYDSQYREEIPAVIHFVQLRQDQHATLHFSFEAFLAVYSAYRSVQPSAIYIHTDFTPADVEHARQHGSSWTRAVLTRFPTGILRLVHVIAPTHIAANNGNGDGDGDGGGREIVRVEHKSDMVRLDALLHHHGGIYLDWDVLTLQSLHPLRHAGFRAVVGRQSDTFINNGVLLASAHSAVVRIMKQETPRVFDGGWITHSVALLTRVANRLAAVVPGEVLIMDFRAFAPFSWEQESVDLLLARHEGDAAAAAAQGGGDGMMMTTDSMAVWESAARTGMGLKEWEYDFSDAFFLHKFFNDVENPRGYNGVSVPYILARDSNYAVAAWPIVQQGIRDGYIDPNDTNL